MTALLSVALLGVEECPDPLEGATADAVVAQATSGGPDGLDRAVTLYRPTDFRFQLEAAPDGNPFDVRADATFRHTDSGETIRTGFFHDGGLAWVLRFTGTRPGTWTVTTSSEVAALDGLAGTITVADDPTEPGFVTHVGNRWARSGTGEVYVPNFLMWFGPGDLAAEPSRIDEAFDVFLGEHGFNGLHLVVINEWFELGSPRTFEPESRDPDPRTFRILEEVIQRVYDTGGTVHLWYSGDRENGGYLRWGPGSEEEDRLLAYIGARLGPLPGWTMGYGFDITEDHTPAQIDSWHDRLQAELGWFHYLGARTEQSRIVDGLHRTSNDPLCERCDYESWVDHRPDYDLYVDLMNRNREAPTFLEDRFRIRAENDIFRIKNYSMEDTRRGLWRGTLAGGAAAIWGNLIGSPGINASAPYPNPEQIKTYATFWEGRFLAEMYRCPSKTDGLCLETFLPRRAVFYAEDTRTIRMNLRGPGRTRTAVAVDTLAPYEEIDLGRLDAVDQVVTLPHVSDWAIAVGDFERDAAGVPTPTPEPAPPVLDDGPIHIIIPHPLNR